MLLFLEVFRQSYITSNLQHIFVLQERERLRTENSNAVTVVQCYSLQIEELYKCGMPFSDFVVHGSFLEKVWNIKKDIFNHVEERLGTPFSNFPSAVNYVFTMQAQQQKAT